MASETLPYSTERLVAISAVRRACALTSSVFTKLVKNETLVKDDKSPVTVGDFSAQALIATILSRAFPGDLIVGEEDAADLRLDSAKDMRERIIGLANEALSAPLADDEKAEWGLGETRTEEELLDAIDRGNCPGGRVGRMWTIDPIDGTKGFLRGEQYAVCLALLVDGVVQLGVLGCPNLPLDLNQPDGERGCIFLAIKGQGATQLNSQGRSPIPLSMPASPPSLAFLESVEAAHSSHSTNDQVAALLGITAPSIRMDSQAKYGCLARGDGGVYMRMPTNKAYREKIWDHAPGSLLITEAGGAISDSHGTPLDFGAGRTFPENNGVIGAGKDVHRKVLDAVKNVLEQEKAKA